MRFDWLIVFSRFGLQGFVLKVLFVRFSLHGFVCNVGLGGWTARLDFEDLVVKVVFSGHVLGLV